MYKLKETLYNIFSFVLSWIAIFAYILILNQLVEEFDMLIGLVLWGIIVCITLYCCWYSNELKNKTKQDEELFYTSMVNFINYTSHFNYSQLKVITNIVYDFTEIKIYLNNNIVINHSIRMRVTDFFKIDIDLLDKLLLSYDYSNLQNKEAILQSVYLNEYIQKNIEKIKQ